MAKKKRKKKGGKKQKGRCTSVELEADDPILLSPGSSPTPSSSDPHQWSVSQVCEWLEGTSLKSSSRVAAYIKRTNLDGSKLFQKSFDSSGTVCGSLTTDDLWIQIGVQKNERHLLATHLLELLGSGLEDFYEWKRGYAPLLLFARKTCPRHLEKFHRVAISIMKERDKSTLDWLVQLQDNDLVKMGIKDDDEKKEILSQVNKLVARLSGYATHADEDEGVLNLFEIAETGGDLSEFQQLCKDLAEVNFKAVDQHGRSLAQLAIVGGNENILKFIFEEDSQLVNWRHPSNSPECLASSDENIVTKFHSNLAEAVHSGNVDCVETVVTAHGFDLDSHYDSKFSLWLHAITQQYIDILRLLCRAHALSKSMEIASSEISNNGDANIVKIDMFRKDQLTVNIEGYGCPLVCAAACATDPKVMGVLLSPYTLGTKHGGYLNRSTLFDPNVQDDDGNTALMFACKTGHPIQVKYLLGYSLRDEHGVYAKPGTPGVVATNVQNNLGQTALMIAAENGSERTVAELLDASNLDIRVRMNDYDRRYLNRSVDMNAVCKNGMSVLHYCARHERELLDTAIALMKSKIDINISDNDGNIALHYASDRGHVGLVEVLLKYNANFSERNKMGQSSLHLASKRGYCSIVNRILDSGAEVDAEDSWLQTPLQYTFESISDMSIKIQELRESAEQDEEEKTSKESEDEKSSSNRVLSHVEKGLSISRETTKEHYESIISSLEGCIKMLLNHGADLDHTDRYGERAFTSAFRDVWFKAKRKDMEDLVNNPIKNGFNEEVFQDPRTQKSVATTWERLVSSSAYFSLFRWLMFVILVVLVTIDMKGGDNYEIYSFQMKVSDQLDVSSWTDDVSSLSDAFEFFHDGAEKFANLPRSMISIGRPRIRVQHLRESSCMQLDHKIPEQRVCYQPMDAPWYGTSASEPRHTIRCGSDEIKYHKSDVPDVKGVMQSYSGGGYDLLISSDPDTFRADLDTVRECFFGSPDVGALMLEGTFYNPDIGSFVPFTFLLENYPTGAVYTSTIVIARDIVPYTGYRDTRITIAMQVVVVLAALYYLREEIEQMLDPYEDEFFFQAPKVWYLTVTRKSVLAERWKKLTRSDGDASKEQHATINQEIRLFTCGDFVLMWNASSVVVPKYLSEPFNYIDMVQWITFVLILVYQAIHIYQSRMIRYDNRSDFVNTFQLAQIVGTKNLLCSVFVFLVFIKTFEHLKVNQQLSTTIIIIFAMAEKLVSMLLVFFLLILSFSISDYVAFSLQKGRPISVFYQIAMYVNGALGNIDPDTMTEHGTDINHYSPFASFFLLFFVIVVIVMFLNLLISVMLEAYEGVRNEAAARWCYCQMEMILDDYTFPDDDEEDDDDNDDNLEKKEVKNHTMQMKTLVVGGTSSYGSTDSTSTEEELQKLI